MASKIQQSETSDLTEEACKRTNESDNIDFTQPWDYGNLIFVMDDGTKLYANKEVLSIHSVVFKTMLTKDFIEKYAESIPLPGKDTKLFIKFLEQTHLSVGDIEDNECCELYQVADEYQVACVKKWCLAKAVSGPKSLKKLLLAETYDLQELRQLCVKYAVNKNICKLEKEEEYEALKPDTKIEILRAQARIYHNKNRNFSACMCSKCISVERIYCSKS